MLNRLSALLFVLVIACAPALSPALAQSNDLDGLRASGAIGERYDGLLVARDPAHGEFVATVNAQRLTIYQERAKSQGIAVDQIGRIYAEQIIERAPAGTWFQAEDGSSRQM